MSTCRPILFLFFIASPPRELASITAGVVLEQETDEVSIWISAKTDRMRLSRHLCALSTPAFNRLTWRAGKVYIKVAAEHSWTNIVFGAWATLQSCLSPQPQTWV